MRATATTVGAQDLAAAFLPLSLLLPLESRPLSTLSPLSFGLSVGLYFLSDETDGIFVGLWVPSILALGAFIAPRSGGGADEFRALLENRLSSMLQGAAAELTEPDEAPAARTPGRRPADRSAAPDPPRRPGRDFGGALPTRRLVSQAAAQPFGLDALFPGRAAGDLAPALRVGATCRPRRGNPPGTW